MSLVTQIFEELSLAVTYDENRQYRDAYFHYLKCLELITNSLRLTTTIRNQKIGMQLIQYSQSCVGRINYIFKKKFEEIHEQTSHREPSKTIKARSLKDFKRQWEEEEIRRMNQEIVYQQQLEKMKQIKEEENREMDKFRKTLKKSRFKWRKIDKWGKFIQKNLNYIEMDNTLLKSDKKVLDDVNSLEGKLGELEPMLNAHFKTILHPTSKHSITSLLMLFIGEMRNSYGTQMDVGNLKSDVEAFTSQFISTVLMKLWTFESGEIEEAAEECIVQNLTRGLWNLGLYNLLIETYLTRNDLVERNGKLDEKMGRFNQNGITLAHLGIHKKFRLVEEREPYKAVIDRFQAMFIVGSVDEKLTVVQDCLKLISECVNSYWNHRPCDYAKQDLIVGAEDLVPIFSYCVIQCCGGRKLNSAWLQFKFMEDFMNEANFRGMSGYSIATLETVLNMIFTLEWGEMEEDCKKILEKEKKKELKKMKEKGITPDTPLSPSTQAPGSRLSIGPGAFAEFNISPQTITPASPTSDLSSECVKIRAQDLPQSPGSSFHHHQQQVAPVSPTSLGSSSFQFQGSQLHQQLTPTSPTNLGVSSTTLPHGSFQQPQQQQQPQQPQLPQQPSFQTSSLPHGSFNIQPTVIQPTTEMFEESFQEMNFDDIDDLLDGI